MLKIGLIILLIFTQNQPQVAQDSVGLEDLLREQQVENQLLEREVELLEEHVKEIRNTLYWALGGVFTLAILFVGVNWFSLNKLYEKDKEKLEQSILEKVGVIEDGFKEKVQYQIERLDVHRVSIYSFLASYFFEIQHYYPSIVMCCTTISEFLLSDLATHNHIDHTLQIVVDTLEVIEDESHIDVKECLIEDGHLFQEIAQRLPEYNHFTEQILSKIKDLKNE